MVATSGGERGKRLTEDHRPSRAGIQPAWLVPARAGLSFCLFAYAFWSYASSQCLKMPMVPRMPVVPDPRPHRWSETQSLPVLRSPAKALRSCLRSKLSCEAARFCFRSPSVLSAPTFWSGGFRRFRFQPVWSGLPPSRPRSSWRLFFMSSCTAWVMSSAAPHGARSILGCTGAP